MHLLDIWVCFIAHFENITSIVYKLYFANN